MDIRLEALVERNRGTVTTAEVLAASIGHSDLEAAARSGALIRIRRGAYVAGARWAAASFDERRRLAAMAVVRTRPGFVLSHHSALALYGLPLWGPIPQRIAMAGPVMQITARPGLHLYPFEAANALEIEGARVVPVARALVGVAVSVGRETAVIAGDAALHRGLVTPEELVNEVALLSPHQGRQRAFDAVALMDGASESVGESRLRLHVHDLGYSYATQVEIRDESGALIARVDLMVEDVVAEFDGMIKYGGAFGQGNQVLWAEKKREDSIRRLGHPVERFIWSELDRPLLIDARIRQAKRLVRVQGRRTA